MGDAPFTHEVVESTCQRADTSGFLILLEANQE
ncbi:hypothetical protein STIAU_8257 [Stigmatella aurantiaca DW4/3-1]|uniref:Uncharacterized protein n=1 Tax=Stigmatella aurantiaca (strain DW4/3-1) TaxID=378806 RepID=Q090S1_STIAD|nr:hypothetical protein STIAU_8257 [Stigmatella aurantiaca DW4/3-1]